MTDAQRLQMIKEIIASYSKFLLTGGAEAEDAFYNLMEDLQIPFADVVVVDLGDSNV